jgi:cell fate regulator YaaT (PSP1 superfamily)
MASILEIEFKGLRRIYVSNPQEFPFQVGDMAVVQVEKGEDLGAVAHLDWRKGAEQDETPPYQVLRKALAEDLEILQRNRGKEGEALFFARRKARERNLEMKFVDVELQWDGRKMTFFFTADGRIDFRELVKDFAANYRTRIDLRQIGARDETKKKGGYGICGLTLCCATWLAEFHPITTQMPRDQSLLLNPMRLSGVCGRLKCCLRYELQSYRDFLERCPVLEQSGASRFPLHPNHSRSRNWSRWRHRRKRPRDLLLPERKLLHEETNRQGPSNEQRPRRDARHRYP